MVSLAFFLVSRWPLSRFPFSAIIHEPPVEIDSMVPALIIALKTPVARGEDIQESVSSFADIMPYQADGPYYLLDHQTPILLIIGR